MYVTDLSGLTGAQRRLRIGMSAEGFDNGEIRIQEGDVVVVDDPDAGGHADGCELIHETVFVGYLKKVIAVDRGDKGHSIELSISAPIGRVPIDAADVGIIAEAYEQPVRSFGMDATRHYASDLVDSDHQSITIESHLGRDGVSDEFWNEYANSRSGPNCPYCTGEAGRDGVRVQTE